MKRLLLLILAVQCSINAVAQSDEDAVLSTFEAYKNAILTDKGVEAAETVDSRTMKYYSDILEKVKTSDSLEVESLGIIDKLMVLRIRFTAPKNEILSFEGKDLFIYAIDKGMVGKSSVVNASLGDVTISGEFAKADFIVNNQKTPFFFHFYYEKETWKIDITHLFSLGTMAFKQLIKDSGQSENDFILNILELLTGKKPTNEIWKPLL